MGSRAVAIICRDEQAAQSRFGITGEGPGIIYTRTGRRFFEDKKIECELLDHLRAALTTADFWNEFETDWFCLDCELMPWSAKAQDLFEEPICRSRRSLPRRAPRCRQNPARGQRPLHRRQQQRARPVNRASRIQNRSRQSLRRSLPPLLLAREQRPRSETSPVPRAGERRQSPHRQRPPMAHANADKTSRRRPNHPAKPGASAPGRND